jgi:hypothetical protein
MGLSPLAGFAARDGAVSTIRAPNVNANRAFRPDLGMIPRSLEAKGEFASRRGSQSTFRVPKLIMSYNQFVIRQNKPPGNAKNVQAEAA